MLDGFVLIISSILDVQDTFISSFYNILSYKESAYYAQDYLKIYSLARENRDKAGENAVDSDADIAFSDVSFKYPNTDRFAVENVSVEIREGEKIAVVGENGSGKTTFCKLLLGLYHPAGGRIERSERFDPSATFQDFCRYSLTVRDNVVISSSADDAKIEKAFAVSGFDKVCAASDLNLDTVLGTVSGEGVNLSGGEWQRLAIARCFYDEQKNVIVLDEPHASLDPVAEVNMYEYYKNIIDFEKKTLIFVTHRLTSAKMCDRIIVLHKGHIVEDGSHGELLAKEGYYRELYAAQAQNYL